MAEYRVIWEINVNADTPEEAARRAREAQEPGTFALHFNVCVVNDDNTLGPVTEVELPIGS